jgi:hypothetical protein
MFWEQVEIANSLSRIPRLHTFDIRLQGKSAPPTDCPLSFLTNFRNLHVIRLRMDKRYFQSNRRAISTMISQSSKFLRDLTVINMPDADFQDATTDECFDGSAISGDLRVSSMRLLGFAITVTPSILPLFRSLTSLDIQLSQSINLWETLTTESIHLHSMKIDEVTEQTLEFVASYTGLRNFYLREFGVDKSPSPQELVSRFCSSGLVAHASTLEGLTIRSFRGHSTWCLSEPLGKLIVSCGRLRSLGVTMSADGLIEATERDTVRPWLHDTP